MTAAYVTADAMAAERDAWRDAARALVRHMRNNTHCKVIDANDIAIEQAYLAAIEFIDAREEER